MKYVLDTHTHTVASGHAYSSIREMAKAASEKNLELLGITEHAPMMPGTCHDFYFQNLRVVDRELYGVELLLGVELNIVNYSGQVDLAKNILKKMDIVIASLHMPCISSGTIEENTAAYLHAMKNPYIDIIGHPDDSRYEIDYKTLVLGAKEHNILLELNNSSLTPGGIRQDTEKNDIEMLNYCRKYNVPIVIGSDAHFDTYVGRHDFAEKLIQEIDFPEELIVNKSVSELKGFVNKYKHK
jgi:Histidinol phosphatase and related hydrolases of the PHP family